MDRQGVITAERVPFDLAMMPEDVGGETIEV